MLLVIVVRLELLKRFRRAEQGALADAHGEADGAGIVRRGRAEVSREGPADVRHSAVVASGRAAGAARRRLRPDRAAIV